MSNYRNILVVLQTEADVRVLLPKVKRLVHGSGATRVHAIRVAYESLADLRIEDVAASAELKNFILTSEESALRDAIATSGTRIEDLESATLWGRKQWQVTLHAAASVSADLIVKSASAEDRKHGLRTPDDWNLLRNAACPVLLATSAQWPSVPGIVTAVDVFDEGHAELNAQLLLQTHYLTEALGAQADIISTFPSMHPWTPHLSTFQNYQEIAAQVRQSAMERLQTLLDQQNTGFARNRVLEGGVVNVIQQVIEDDPVNLLVVGTTARKGIEGVLIGNTAERLIHEIQIDVLTVPAP